MIVMWFLMLFAYAIAPAAAQNIDSNQRNFFDNQMKNRTPMHVAVLTQRGYIQFLKWEMPVPEIQEFTFCVWVKSTNLTYPHSIFSYSKNEKDRLVRAWIAPGGRSVHLEINNIEIFAQPTAIQEHRWYHICQSWDNGQGRYGLWIDGQIELDGYVPEMAGHVIPKNGDVVLGQEYTDFNKGLEEGIEGAVLGFNLLLASAFDTSDPSFERNQLEDEISSIDFPALINSDGITKSIGPAVFPRSAQRILKPVTSGSRIVRVRKARQMAIIPPWVKNSPSFTAQPTGMRLIAMGYHHCELGRGSPFIGRNRLFISWTRTPVKVFGGAILKNVDSQCGIFNVITG